MRKIVDVKETKEARMLRHRLEVGVLTLATLVLTACGGGGSSSSPPNPPPPSADFSLLLSSSTVTLGTGDTATLPVLIQPINGFSGTVSVSVLGMTPEKHLTATAITIAAGSTGTVTISSHTDAPYGNVSGLRLHGVSGALTHDSSPFNVIIKAGGSGSVIPDKFAYVINATCFYNSSGCVYPYTIDPSTGDLSPGTPVGAGSFSKVLSADSSGKFLYVGGNDISMFKIDGRSGALTPLVPATVPGGTPEWMGVHPSGKFVYLANDSNTSIDVFALNTQTGFLTQRSSAYACLQSMLPAGISLDFDTDGKFLFVPQGCSFENILTFSIDETTGALSRKSAAQGPFQPTALAVLPNGRFAYVLSDVISMYGIDASGTLGFLKYVNAGYMPSGIAIAPSGKFLYITNQGDNTVSQYSIDGTTGELSSLGAIGGLESPVGLTIERSGRFLYVVNGQQSGCTYGIAGGIQKFTIGTTGNLTPGKKVCADIMALQIVTTTPKP